MKGSRGLLAGVLCVGAVFGGPAAAQAAPPEPDFVFFPHLSNVIPTPPPLQGPCGLVVSRQGRVFASNYYAGHIEEVARPTLKTLAVHADPLDGPCGIDFDLSGRLYVNNYHRNVVRYQPSGFPPSSTTVFNGRTVIDSSSPTGVAVDPATDHVYVNARTEIAAYESSGAPVIDDGQSLRIGAGSLGDGYGLAISSHPATAGRIYVADHADDTVKVYDPAIDKEEPVQTIAGPPGGFGSLRDSALAIDEVSGEVYVADTRAYPQYTEKPEATIYVFDPTGAYEGRLKHNVVDGSPVGLAVDNSVDEFDNYNPTQGRVYVTTGNTFEAGVYAYPSGSATTQTAPPLFTGFATSPIGVDHPGGVDRTQSRATTVPLEPLGLATSSVAAQKGTLRVTVEGRLAPRRLPRRGAAPISVSVGGRITTTDDSMPPQLKAMRIELNRGGRIETAGLPACSYDRIQPGSSRRALSACRDSLVGKGSFTADITLAGQEPYPTGGKMLLFHSIEKGKPVLYGHIYSPKPFATSFVIVFAVQKIAEGTYGIALNAPLPPAMDAWGRLTGLQMTLQRRYSHRGRPHSFLSAGCPAPKGFTAATFPLARTEFSFDGGQRLRSTLTSQCKVRH